MVAGTLPHRSPLADTTFMSDANEPEDYWQQQFREARERAALLAEASVPELVELHHAAGPDFDLGSVCFEALQRRPRPELLAAGLRERRAKTVRRREFAATLIDLSIDSEAERVANLPYLIEMLRDRSPRVVGSVLSALELVQSGATSREQTRRIRAGEAGTPKRGWPPLPAAVPITDLTALATHREPWVRMALAGVPALCGERSALDLLMFLSRDSDSTVRAAAAHSVGMRRIAGGSQVGVRERLWEMYKTDPNRFANLAALEALLEYDPPATLPTVERVLGRALARGTSCRPYYTVTIGLFRHRDAIATALRERMTEQWQVKWDVPAPSLMLPAPWEW